MPLPALAAAALISGGAGIAGGLLGMFGQQQANKQSYKQQIDLMNRQQDFTREMWEKQTAENRESILNQYAQYRQLGINPLSALGGLSQSNQSAPSAPSVPQSNYKNPLEGAELAVTLSQAAKNIAEAKKTEAEVPKVQAETAFTWSQQQTVEALRNKQVEALGVSIKLDEGRYKLTNKQTEQVTKEIELIGKRKEEIDANIRNSTIVSEAQYWSAVNDWIHNRAMEEHWTVQEQQQWKEIANETRRVSAYINDVNSLVEQRKHQNDLTDAEKKEVEQRTENLKKEGEKLGYEVDLTKNTLTWRTDAENMRLELQYAADQGELLITNEKNKYNRGHRSTVRDVHAVEQVLGPFKEILALFGMAFGISKGVKSGTPAVSVPKSSVATPSTSDIWY